MTSTVGTRRRLSGGFPATERYHQCVVFSHVRLRAENSYLKLPVGIRAKKRGVADYFYRRAFLEGWRLRFLRGSVPRMPPPPPSPLREG